MRRIAVIAMSLGLAACGPHTKPSSSPINVAKAPDPAPIAVARDTFKGCTWQKVQGARLSIWSFACGPDMGSTHLIADDKVDGFDLTANGEGRMVIRTFAKAANAPVDAILPAVKAASPGKDTQTCALVPVPTFDAWSGQLYDLEPTGAAKAAYDKANAVEPQEPPCGDLGIGPDGDRFFAVMKDDPTRVVYVDMGSEIQIFDPNTLKAQ